MQVYFLGVLLSLVLLVFGLVWLSESYNQRVVAEANAYAIRTSADASARLTQAQATAIILVAFTPLLFSVLAGFALLTFSGAALLHVIKQKPRVIYQIENRGEVWRLLSHIEHQNQLRE